ncbi:MBL fold metallo-hydrolase [Allosalinactinospora lopnorensis]|uniref:MBL fold metallo-hydrolase n=1 Tax=Allosalinactinospora lopnorensis TaxID=1352348 RepID=UPI000A6FFA83|nr:MBL fold metallo-hydrolase [Allosalinactinospora lopnorensis]
MSSARASLRHDTVRWDEAGVETVVDGVHRVALPLPEDGLKAVNVYVLEDSAGLTLIDGGWALTGAFEVLDTSLNQLGYCVGDLRDVMVTHIHRDHYTQAVWLRDRYRLRVLLGADERPGLEELRRIRTNLPTHAFDRLRSGGADGLLDELAAVDWPPYDPTVWKPPDVWLEDGDVVGRLEAVSTPGHTQGHLVFRDESRSLLFSGDHVLPHITPSIGFELGGGALPLKDYLESLHRVLRLPDCALLPAHGPVTDSVHDRVHDLLRHHEQRFDACLDVVASGSTAFDVATGLTWTRRERAFGELDAFNRMLAVCETVAHLDVLVDGGHLGVDEHDGVRRYGLGHA